MSEGDPGIEVAHAAAGAAAGIRGKAGGAAASGIETAVTVGTLASGAGVSGTVGGLLTSAGVAGATGIGVPVGLALGVAAGVVAFVAHMRKGRMTRRQARALAKKLHIPHANQVLGWTRRVLQAQPPKRMKMRSALRRQIKRVKKIKSKRGIAKAWARATNPGSLLRNQQREKLKLLVVNTVIGIDNAAARGMAEQAGPPPADVGFFEGLGLPGAGISGVLPWFIGGALFLIVMAAARK